MWFFSHLTRENLYFNAGANIIFATIDDPCDCRNYKDNSKGGNTIVYEMVSDATMFKTKENILMLLPVAGSSGGNRNRTVVRAMYTSEI